MGMFVGVRPSDVAGQAYLDGTREPMCALHVGGPMCYHGRDTDTVRLRPFEERRKIPGNPVTALPGASSHRECTGV